MIASVLKFRWKRAILCALLAMGVHRLAMPEEICDDFSDGELWDCAPLCWRELSLNPGSSVYAPVGGCLEVSTEGEIGVCVLDSRYDSGSISVRVQGSFNGTDRQPNEGGAYPYIGAMSHEFESGGFNAYLGDVDSQGNLSLAKYRNYDVAAAVQGRLGDFDPWEDEGEYVDLEIELTATERPGPELLLELRVWKFGDPRPRTANLSMVDRTNPYSGGVAGFSFWQNSGNPLKICSICIDPEPTSDLSPVSFVRGDANADGELDLSDAAFILNYLFSHGTTPECEKSADTDDGGDLDLTDAVYLLTYLFLGGPAPEPPFPTCGPDPTPDDLTCESFVGCEEP
jgi:hypothetical protein